MLWQAVHVSVLPVPTLAYPAWQVHVDALAELVEKLGHCEHALACASLYEPTPQPKQVVPSGLLKPAGHAVHCRLSPLPLLEKPAWHAQVVAVPPLALPGGHGWQIADPGEAA